MDLKLTAFCVGLFGTISIAEYKIALRVHKRKRKKENSCKGTQILQVISLCHSIGLFSGGSNRTKKISRELRM